MQLNDSPGLDPGIYSVGRFIFSKAFMIVAKWEFLGTSIQHTRLNDKACASETFYMPGLKGGLPKEGAGPSVIEMASKDSSKD